MYNVILTNNYTKGVFLNGGNQPIGPKGIFPHFGSSILNVTGMGDINFFDLGETKLEQYTNPHIPWTSFTWGGLIRYRGIDAYFRYEGGVDIEMVLDAYGSVTLHFPQGGMIINLDDMSVN